MTAQGVKIKQGQTDSHIGNKIEIEWYGTELTEVVVI